MEKFHKVGAKIKLNPREKVSWYKPDDGEIKVHDFLETIYQDYANTVFTVQIHPSTGKPGIFYKNDPSFNRWIEPLLTDFHPVLEYEDVEVTLP